MPRLAGTLRPAIGPGRIRGAFLAQRQWFLREERKMPVGLAMSKFIVVAVLVPFEPWPPVGARRTGLPTGTLRHAQRPWMEVEDGLLQRLKALLTRTRIGLLNPLLTA